MKKSLDIFIWAVLLFLITPSGMALASWNAVPGDATYSWKLSLEKILIAILSPSDKLQSTTQVKIAERRFNEFEQIVESEYAIEGLKNLNEQIAVTTSGVQKIDQNQSRSEVTETYVDSLKKMSASLDEQKSKAKTGQITFATNQKTTTSSSKPKSSSSNPTSSSPTVKPGTTQPTIQPVTQPIAQPSGGQATQAPQNPQEPSAPVNPDEVIEQIEETQNNIEQVIKELEKIQEEEEEKKNQGNNNAFKDLSPEERKELIEKIQDKVEKKDEKNDKKD